MTAMNERSPEYVAYLKSKAWKQLRDRLVSGTYRCQGCGKLKLPSQLQVHHLTYDNLGREKRGDLAVLCADCHKLADQLRAQRSEDSMYDRRLTGWAEKVYGEDWADSPGWLEASEAFDDWLERRE